MQSYAERSAGHVLSLQIHAQSAGGGSRRTQRAGMEWGAIRVEAYMLAAAARVPPAKQGKKVGVGGILRASPFAKAYCILCCLLTRLR